MRATSTVVRTLVLRLSRQARVAALCLSVVGAPIICTAQPVTNPTFVEFDASVDHNRVSPGGLDALTGYVFEISGPGAPKPAYWIDVGKPTAQSGGRIRVPVGASGGWPAGGPYTLRVAAIGPGGTRLSAPSNAFVLPGVGQPCATGVSGMKLSLPAAGGGSTVAVSAPPGCFWQATPSASWLVVTPAAGLGAGSVDVTAAANTATARSATIAIGNKTVTVSQAAVSSRPPTTCALTLTPGALVFARTGGSATVRVSTGNSCTWRGGASASWVSASQTRGKGSATIRVTVARNRRSSSRAAVLTLGGVRLVVTQTATAGTPRPTSPASSTGASTQQPQALTLVLPSAAPTRAASSRLVVLNPTDADASMTVTTASASASPTEIIVPARARLTLDPADVGLDTMQPTLASSGAPIVVERTTDVSGEAAITEVATPAGTSEWFFADGAAATGAWTTLVVRNPTTEDVAVRTRYFTPEGGIETTHDVGAAGELTVDVAEDVAVVAAGAGPAAEVGAEVRSQNGAAILVERAVGWRAADGTGRTDDVVESGTTAASTTWWFATAEARPSVERFLTIVNPDPATDTGVRVDYRRADGRVWIEQVTVPASGRRTLWIDAEQFAGTVGRPLDDAAVGIAVSSVTDVPIVAEVARWRVGATAGTWQRMSGVPGASRAGPRWAIADGDFTDRTGLAAAAEIVIRSLGDGEAAVTAIGDDGTEQSVVVPLQAGAAARVDVAAVFPQLAGLRFSLLIESVGPSPVDVVVERANVSRGGAVTRAMGRLLP